MCLYSPNVETSESLGYRLKNPKTPLEVWRDLVFTAEQIRGCYAGCPTTGRVSFKRDKRGESDWWKVKKSAVILDYRDQKKPTEISSWFVRQKVLWITRWSYAYYPPFVRRIAQNYWVTTTWLLLPQTHSELSHEGCMRSSLTFKRLIQHSLNHSGISHSPWKQITPKSY